VRCDVAELALSAAMDDPAERIPPDVAGHVEGCARCSAFNEGAWRVRRLARFEVAPPVPFLVPEIMERVGASPPAKSPTRVPGKPMRWRRAAGLAAAVGLLAGYLVTSGFRGPAEKGSRALAEEIPHRLVAAAVALRGYRATFDVTERNWARAVPVRTFVAAVAWRAPEHLRVTVHDTTAYPKGDWIANDQSLVSDGRTWVARGPQSCAEGTAPSCQGRTSITRVVEHRVPFDSQSALPTDVIVPMTVLAAQGRVDVIGRTDVGGQPAIGVAMSANDAEPLWGFLRFLGSWRPFFPQDRVEVWLDARTWFPLRYEVLPAAGAARRLWARQLGLPLEPPDRPVFTAVARTFEAGAPPVSEFRVRVPASGAVPVDEGFADDPNAAGAVPVPASTDGLARVRSGALEGGGERIVAYASGLAWLTVEQVSGRRRDGPFGVGPFAEPVALAGGPASYEPASDDGPRRVAIRTDGAEYLLSTNLPRAALLRMASSMPVQPLPEPRSWLVHRSGETTVVDGLDPASALAAAPFPALEPAALPAGYLAGGAQTFAAPGVHAVTVVYRRPAAELGGVGLELYQALGEALPPPTDDDQFQVRLTAGIGRWSPADHRLEWVGGDGVYRSLTGVAFDLESLVAVADSLRSPGSRP
jgi:hypothetical protein